MKNGRQEQEPGKCSGFSKGKGKVKGMVEIERDLCNPIYVGQEGHIIYTLAYENEIRKTPDNLSPPSLVDLACLTLDVTTRTVYLGKPYKDGEASLQRCSFFLVRRRISDKGLHNISTCATNVPWGVNFPGYPRRDHRIEDKFFWRSVCHYSRYWHELRSHTTPVYVALHRGRSTGREELHSSWNESFPRDDLERSHMELPSSTRRCTEGGVLVPHRGRGRNQGLFNHKMLPANVNILPRNSIKDNVARTTS